MVELIIQARIKVYYINSFYKKNTRMMEVYSPFNTRLLLQALDGVAVVGCCPVPVQLDYALFKSVCQEGMVES